MRLEETRNVLVGMRGRILVDAKKRRESMGKSRHYRCLCKHQYQWYVLSCCDVTYHWAATPPLPTCHRRHHRGARAHPKMRRGTLYPPQNASRTVAAAVRAISYTYHSSLDVLWSSPISLFSFHTQNHLTYHDIFWWWYRQCNFDTIATLPNSTHNDIK